MSHEFPYAIVHEKCGQIAFRVKSLIESFANSVVEHPSGYLYWMGSEPQCLTVDCGVELDNDYTATRGQSLVAS